MSVLMSKKKAEAIKSVERDRHLISDATARDRVVDAEPKKDREALRRFSESREYLDMRMKSG